MSKIFIIGEQNPQVGKEYKYSLSSWGLGSMPNNIFNPNLEIAKWEIYVLENGKWRKTTGNSKQGEIAPYTFSQNSLTKKGIKICVTKGENKGELIIKPKRAGQPKINKIELLDVNGKTVTKPLSYLDTLTVKAHCTDMEGETLQFTLWEDDAKGPKHNTINTPNKINTFPVLGTVKKGIAQANFRMFTYWNASMIANAKVAQGDKNEGKTHEYYATAEYFGKQEASNNVNLKNPAYNPSPVPLTTPTNGNKNGQTKPQKKQPNQRPAPTTQAPKKDTYKVPITQGAKTRASDPKGKIISVSFSDSQGKPVSSLKTSTGVVAKIVANNMKGKTVRLKLWDEDPVRNDLIFSKDYVLIGDENYIGISITWEMWDEGNDGGDSGAQDYFLEVEYAGDEKTSGVVKISKDALPKKQEVESVSTSGIGKAPKEKFNKVIGLGKEAVIYISSEIATEIKLDNKGNITFYPDSGGYNGQIEYKEGNKIYSKKLSASKSAFPLYKAYIYRGGKVGEAVKKLKQDLENKTTENAESTILTVARHAQTNNKDYGKSGPLPPNNITKLYRVRYMQAWNHAKKESFRYRIVDDNQSNLKPVKDISKEVSSGAMTLGNRGSISIDPWNSNGLIGCVGIRAGDGGTHSSCKEEYSHQDKVNYKFIYHALNNYLETIIPELKGVYGRRGYSSNGKVSVATSDYKEEVKVFVLVDPLPEINNCNCELKKDGREEFYEDFGNSAINAIKNKSSANKFKGLYMVAQRRQENGLKRKVPNNNPMNIKSSGDLGKSDLYTREVINGKEVYINDGFGNFSTIEKGFEGYLELLQKNWLSAYQALTDDSKTINDFTKGLQEKGKYGAYATDPTYISGIQTIFKGVVSDYKKILDCKLCKEKDSNKKNEIKKDIELLNKLK